MDRKDWSLGRLHIIRRRHGDYPQYGCLAWGRHTVGYWTVDVWLNRTLWTFTSR